MAIFIFNSKKFALVLTFFSKCVIQNMMDIKTVLKFGNGGMADMMVFLDCFQWGKAELSLRDQKKGEF